MSRSSTTASVVVGRHRRERWTHDRLDCEVVFVAGPRVKERTEGVTPAQSTDWFATPEDDEAVRSLVDQKCCRVA